MRAENPWLKDVACDDMRRIVDALYRVHRLIAVITDLDTLLERILEESKRVAQAEACSLLLYDAATEELYFQVAQGDSGNQHALKRHVHLKLNEGIAGVAASTRQSINVEDARNDPRFYRAADEVSQFTTRSLLAVPLLDREDLIGVVEVVNKIGGGSFTETDLRVLEMFSALAATAIANARLIEENLRKERMAAIGQALAGLSHYIKNIVTGMSGSTELLDAALAKKDLDVIARAWPIFKRTTRRITIFVQDMLQYSKPREPKYEACDLRQLFDEAAETFTGLQAPKELKLEIEADGVAGPVFVDVQGLHSCLLNLLTNAADAAPARGGHVRMAAHENSQGDLAIEVADNGPGVPDEHRHLIFEPFFSTKGSRGTGLGLAVTRKIVHEHGGSITVERGPEGGALFRIVLPKAHERKGKKARV